MVIDKTLNLERFIRHPISTTITVLLTMFAVGWAFYRPFLIEDLSADFVTKAELTRQMGVMTTQMIGQLSTMQTGQDTQKVALDAQKVALDGLSTQVNVGVAFQMERRFQDDLDKHSIDKTNPPTSRWLKTQREIVGKRDLAQQYRNCVLNEEKNCNELQKQLLQ